MGAWRTGALGKRDELPRQMGPADLPELHRPEPEDLGAIADQDPFERAEQLADRVALPVGKDLVDDDRRARDRPQRRLRPVVEVNARMSFGHVAAALGRRIAPGCAGVWLVVPRDTLPGHDFAAWIEALERAHPLRTRDRPVRLVDGALATSDPATVERFGSVLLVAPNLAAIARRLRDTAPLFAERLPQLDAI